MNFHLKTIIKNNVNAFEQCAKDNIWFTIFVTIFSLIGIIVTVFKPDIYIIIYSHVCISAFIIILIIIFFICLFHKWKSNHFFLTTVEKICILVITGSEDNSLFVPMENILLPSEDYMLFTLKLTFDETVQRELKDNKKEYTIIFEKPDSLEIKYQPINKDRYEIKNEGLEDNRYCMVRKYRTTDKDSLLFKLESDHEEDAKLKFHFGIGDCSDNIENIISDKSPLLIEKISFEEIEIENNNCITIDKRITGINDSEY